MGVFPSGGGELEFLVHCFGCVRCDESGGGQRGTLVYGLKGLNESQHWALLNLQHAKREATWSAQNQVHSLLTICPEASASLRKPTK
ncbi:hypothetical protein VTK26DRAFT_3838 [Humicola hyalothermophila]